MTTKDWKIFGKNSEAISWVKKKDNYGSNPHINGESIGISSEVGSWINGNFKEVDNWNFKVTNKGFITNTKLFKNKSLALKFARQYMRTH